MKIFSSVYEGAMDYLSLLKEMNVKFGIIGEEEALRIMSAEYSYYKLMEYAPVFDRYRCTAREGAFVNLEFAELYFLAEIDSRFGRILMCICLEVEKFLKATLLFDAERFCDTKLLMREYYESDKEYLEKNYVSENFEILREKYGADTILSMSMHQFVDVVQFGTLERLIHFFYKTYAGDIYNKKFAPFEKLIGSVKRIRNAAAHNNSLLSGLNTRAENRALITSAFLGKHGVKSKMLRTNMSRMVIADCCDVLFLYYRYVPGNKEEVSKMFRCLDERYCRKYAMLYRGNYTLKSVYEFLCMVLSILQNNIDRSK